MTQTREKWNSLVLSKANGEGAMALRIFMLIFLFRTNDKKEHLDENDFNHPYGNYVECAILKVT